MNVGVISLVISILSLIIALVIFIKFHKLKNENDKHNRRYKL